MSARKALHNSNNIQDASCTENHAPMATLTSWVRREVLHWSQNRSLERRGRVLVLEGSGGVPGGVWSGPGGAPEPCWIWARSRSPLGAALGPVLEFPWGCSSAVLGVS